MVRKNIYSKYKNEIKRKKENIKEKTKEKGKIVIYRGYIFKIYYKYNAYNK